MHTIWFRHTDVSCPVLACLIARNGCRGLKTSAPTLQRLWKVTACQEAPLRRLVTAKDKLSPNGKVPHLDTPSPSSYRTLVFGETFSFLSEGLHKAQTNSHSRRYPHRHSTAFAVFSCDGAGTTHDFPMHSSFGPRAQLESTMS